jgi:hypothetical protein
MVSNKKLLNRVSCFLKRSWITVSSEAIYGRGKKELKTCTGAHNFEMLRVVNNYQGRSSKEKSKVVCKENLAITR